MIFLKKKEVCKQDNIRENKRNTSFELMRILSMFMVCAFHWQLHGYNDSISSSNLCVNQIISFVFGSWGILGVNLFFILSFYFLNKKKENSYSKIIRLVIKVSFFGTTIYIIGILIGATNFSYIQMIKSIFGVFAYQYWFITVYIIILIIAPMLNKILAELSTRECHILLSIMIYVTYCVSWIIGSEIAGRLSCGITIYILIYTLENKINYNFFEKYRILAIPGIIVGILGEIVLSYLGGNNPIFYKMIEKLQTTNSPYMLIISLFVFYIFKNMKLNYNRVVNFLGKYAVGAYLLHGGASFIKNYLWDGLFEVGKYYKLAPLEYISHYIICIILLFVVGVICDFIYSNFLEKVLIRKI